MKEAKECERERGKRGKSDREGEKRDERERNEEREREKRSEREKERKSLREKREERERLARQGVPLFSQCIWMYARAFEQPVFSTKGLSSLWTSDFKMAAMGHVRCVYKPQGDNSPVPVNSPVATGRALLTFSHSKPSLGLLFVLLLQTLPNIET